MSVTVGTHVTTRVSMNGRDIPEWGSVSCTVDHGGEPCPLGPKPPSIERPPEPEGWFARVLAYARAAYAGRAR